MLQAVTLAAAAWAAWALTARVLYQRWAAAEQAERGSDGNYGVIAFIAMAFAVLLPAALAVVVMHAGTRAGRLRADERRLCEAAAALEQATARLAAANDACEQQIQRSRRPPDRACSPEAVAGD